MGGHAPSLDAQRRVSGKVGNKYYWNDNLVSASYFNYARRNAMEKGHAANKQKGAEPVGKKGRS
jgi:hypothetical protein